MGCTHDRDRSAAPDDQPGPGCDHGGTQHQPGKPEAGRDEPIEPIGAEGAPVYPGRPCGGLRLVTGAGAFLSHSAIIAREYRIPAVVATGNATRVLRDGQVVTVDGVAVAVGVQRPGPDPGGQELRAQPGPRMVGQVS